MFILKGQEQSSLSQLSSPAQKQNNEKQTLAQDLEEKALEYRNWHRLVNVSLSPNGQWSYFIKKYDDGRGEGVLQNTQTKAFEIFPQPAEVYLDDKHFILRDQQGNLKFKNLRSGKEWKESQVKKYEYHPISKSLLLMKAEELYWVDENNSLIKKYIKVSRIEQLTTPERKLIQQQSQIVQINLKTQKEEIILPIGEKEQLLAFGEDTKDGKTLFLMRKSQGYILESYGIMGNQFLKKNITEIVNGYTQFSFRPPHILLGTKSVTSTSGETSQRIEEWDSSDRGLAPLIERYRNSQVNALIYDFSTDKTRESNAEDGVTRKFIVFGNRYALEVLDLANEDFTDEHLIPKIELRNLETQMIEWAVEKTTDFYVIEHQQIIYYFDQGQWWIYDGNTHKTHGITEKVEEPFYYYSRQSKKYKQPIDKPVFSKDYQKVYLTSAYNIWEYNLKKKQLINLTQNKDENLQYKIQKFGSSRVENLKWNDVPTLPQDEIIIRLKTSDDFLEGLMVYHKEKLKIIEPLQGSSFESIIIGNTGFSYTFENGNTPFQLKMYQWKSIYPKPKNNSNVVLFQSNQENYKNESFPKTEVLTWEKESSLQKYTKNYATVILPSGYTPNNKYPTIVHLYENKAKEYKDFVYPSWYNQQGMNRSLLAQKGYIIILPRITYSQNEPGASALRSIEEAIEEVKNKYSIDVNKIGIAGESFGGFETNYIITRTKKFKAAVSGVSVADITASYFSYNTNFLRPNIWRFTNQSYRLTGNFYELKEVFYENNPVFHADKIETPLLLWAGKEDYHVNWNQSVAMYVALAGLKKEVKLLLFPKDGHGLLRKFNQLEATQRIMEWWDKYLKE
ncbi:hypothetical protein GCM10010992_27500 [Cloacibacterium rupense]|uniref:Peptidase S9 prolyl oligopeptidase catalytic domain-containing protein n=1 Tax=Cloacibacterium rupense TaxID=517423 RepID=A0ABQ2NNB1_9FLAO|nr:prolyl oligopeptidase family serine peptidase [Cloacibacterium rupense]GGP06668.1 hypothetical protein GCM10010992_27500 [Cloacibacterium rupense]